MFVAPVRPERRLFLKRALTGSGIVAVLGGAAALQGYQFGVTQHSRALPGLQRPLRVALLTDLHYGLYIATGSVRRWVQATVEQRPDLILLGGDLLDTRFEAQPDELVAALGGLRAPLGTYGVWGNHDYGSFGSYQSRHYGARHPDWRQRREAVRQALESVGIVMLRNQGRALRDDLWLGGIDDLWHGRPDVATALRGAGERATLLLTHNPDVLPELPQRVGLTLCGHTHGGQVRFPLLGPIPNLVPSRYGTRYVMGWVEGAHGSPAYVSRGLGMSGLPFRNLCPPEITVLTLNSPPAH